MATPFQITVDCVDADVMCRFWSVALGYVEEPPPAGYLSWEDFLRANDITIPPPGSIGAIVDPDGTGPRVLFIRVPEQKCVKNRLALRPARRQERRGQRGQDHRAHAKPAPRTVRRVEENGQWWMVMGDPEGNEFCVT